MLVFSGVGVNTGNVGASVTMGTLLNSGVGVGSCAAAGTTINAANVTKLTKSNTLARGIPGFPFFAIGGVANVSGFMIPSLLCKFRQLGGEVNACAPRG